MTKETRGGGLGGSAALLLSLAFGCSGLAAGSAGSWLSDFVANGHDLAAEGERTVLVIVTARRLGPGTPITVDDLYAVQLPPRYLPEGVFLDPGAVVGRVTAEAVLANEILRAERLQ